MIELSKKEKFQSVLIALITLVMLLFITEKYLSIIEKETSIEARKTLMEILVSKKSNLEKALSSRIYYTKGIAAYVAIHPEISNEKFYELANELIQNDSVINSMALSKNCVIGAIYPLKGHEAAIGLDLLAHPFRRQIVEKTIETHKTFVAGPVELVEGGIAFISYTPIYKKIQNDSSVFWGVTDIVILKNRLFNEVGLRESDDKYFYAIRGVDGKGIQGECFFGNDSLFYQNPVIVDIVLPTGNWSFAAVPKVGWYKLYSEKKDDYYFLYLVSVILAGFVWLISNSYYKIKANERELLALFNSMEELIIIFDRAGRYVKIAPTNQELLVKPASELLGRTLFEIFDNKQATFFFDAINECFNTKKTVIIDYQLLINGENLWFQARLTPISDDYLIYVAFNNTYQKKIEENLKESKEKLMILNKTKDRFFSIIAHDLRSPFQVLLGYSRLLYEEIDSLDKEQIVMFSKQINKALENQFELLNDLLEWAKLQNDKITLDLIKLNLFELVNSVFTQLETIAKQKNILLKNSVEPDIELYADMNMIKLVLRNLVSNSIKFSNAKGIVEVKSNTTENEIEISVIDQGVGISKEIIDKILSGDLINSSSGTSGEKGTGLGLSLCKEVIEKHKGKFWIKSEINKGTIITFSLPKQ